MDFRVPQPSQVRPQMRPQVRPQMRPQVRNSLGRNVYSNVRGMAVTGSEQAARLGRVIAVVQFIGSFIASCILIGVGVWLLLRKKTYDGSADARIVKSECSESIQSSGKDGKKEKIVECKVTYTYDVRGKSYTQQLVTHDRFHAEGDMLPIHYQSSNPQNSDRRPAWAHWKIATLLIGIGVFVLLLASIYLYIKLSFSMVAAASGVGTTVGVFSNALR